MIDRIRDLVEKARAEIGQAGDPSAVEALRVKYLGKKGELALVLRGMGQVSADDRPKVGAAANEAKSELELQLDTARVRLEATALDAELALSARRTDVTLPGRRAFVGARHPVTRALEEMVAIFERLGFAVASGPEVEDDAHNFEALNFPPDHPARDMQDTFYVEGGWLLRTHTSPVQIRVMRTQKPPVRIVCPGKVFRSDADVTHSPMFHQIEGLLVDRRVTMAELKGTLQAFTHGYYGPEIGVRLRPSYFPFVEPGAELDITCIFCTGTGTLPGGQPCRVCKQTGWLEVGGAGMVHPNVFRAVGYDPAQVSGFAFGMGVERLVMLRHVVGDIRLLFENDMRFLEQLK